LSSEEGDLLEDVLVVEGQALQLGLYGGKLGDVYTRISEGFVAFLGLFGECVPACDFS
jgi:hypothetical protein